MNTNVGNILKQMLWEYGWKEASTKLNIQPVISRKNVLICCYMCCAHLQREGGDCPDSLIERLLDWWRLERNPRPRHSKDINRSVQTRQAQINSAHHTQLHLDTRPNPTCSWRYDLARRLALSWPHLIAVALSSINTSVVCMNYGRLFYIVLFDTIKSGLFVKC